MDWFERITGFREDGYDRTRARLSIVDGRLHSTQGDRTCAVGELSIPSLVELRHSAAGLATGHGAIRVSSVQGDVRRLHRDIRNAGALFQVASQFNLLEMVGPTVTPEDGVTGYESDPTQGPACAIAAGAGTIYRNYFAPVDGQAGQREDRQIDGLHDLGEALGNADGSLWQMRNGYCLTTDEGLANIDDHLQALSAAQRDELKGRLRIGVQRDVEVTDENVGHRVSQAYCSALPVAYNRVRHPQRWQRFACLVLEAAYEATLLAAMLAPQRPVVFLTRLGGGAFGNDDHWIDAAMRQALASCRDGGLDVRIVSHGEPAPGTLALVKEFGG